MFLPSFFSRQGYNLFVNRLNYTNSYSFFHVSNYKPSKRWVFFKIFYYQRLQWNEFNYTRVSFHNKLWVLFDYNARLRVDFFL